MSSLGAFKKVVLDEEGVKGALSMLKTEYFRRAVDTGGNVAGGSITVALLLITPAAAEVGEAAAGGL